MTPSAKRGSSGGWSGVERSEGEDHYCLCGRGACAHREADALRQQLEGAVDRMAKLEALLSQAYRVVGNDELAANIESALDDYSTAGGPRKEQP